MRTIEATSNSFIKGYEVTELEERIITKDIICYLPYELDSRIPKGSYGKIINNKDMIILTKEEYQKEIANCKNIINVGGKDE